jgi:hypothetical protein
MQRQRDIGSREILDQHKNVWHKLHNFDVGQSDDEPRLPQLFDSQLMKAGRQLNCIAL